MNERSRCTTYTLALTRGPIAPTGPSTYSLGQAAKLGGVHPEMLRYYCQIGLLGRERTRPSAQLSFNDDALYELRRIEHYRRHHGLSRRTLRMMAALWREIDGLNNELRFLRGA